MTHNSLIDSKRTALKFVWTPANTTLNNNEPNKVSALLKEAAIQLCLVGFDCRNYETIDTLFIDEAVHLFNKYLIDHEKSITTLIKSDSGK